VQLHDLLDGVEVRAFLGAPVDVIVEVAVEFKMR